MVNNADSSYPEGTKLFNSYDQNYSGRLSDLLRLIEPLKCGQARTFYDVGGACNAVTVVGLGPGDIKVNDIECFDESKENIRLGIAGKLSTGCALLWVVHMFC